MTKLNDSLSAQLYDWLKSDRVEKLLPWFIIIAFSTLTLYTICIHEPWFDEAQGWLLVRDSSLRVLLFDRLRYEGHPPLWYLFIYPFVRLGFPYEGIGLLSATLGILGTATLALDRRIPMALRVVVPFTYFMAYQYAIIARSYALCFPILMALVRIWPNPIKRPRSFGLLLGLLALVSAHGVCMAWTLALYATWEAARDENQRPQLRARKAIWGALILLSATFITAWVIRPPGNLAIQPRLDLYRQHFLELLPRTLLKVADTLGNSVPVGLLLLVGIFGWLYAHRRLLLAVLLLASLIPLLTIYMNHWHEGLLFLALLFPLLVASLPIPQEPRSPAILRHFGLICLGITGILHCYWTASAVVWDAGHAYSGAYKTAMSVTEPVRQGKRIAVMGFAGLGIQPYFRQNIYCNYHIPGGGSYWHWGHPSPLYYAPSFLVDPNVVSDWARKILADQPDFIVVSLKLQYEHVYVDTIKQDGRYQPFQLSEGSLFWKTEPIESETFLILKRIPGK